MIPHGRRESLVRKFIRLGRALEGALPGERPQAEARIGQLVGSYDRELLEIAATAAGDAELQLAAWLRDLASMPNGATIGKELSWIRVSMRLLPRPRGSFLLGRATYSVPLSAGDR